MSNRTIQFSFDNDQMKDWGIRAAKIAVIFCSTAFLLYWTLKLLAPFLVAIALGFITYRIFAPMHNLLVQRFWRGRFPRVAAGISTLLVAVIILLPIASAVFFSLIQIISFCQQAFAWFQDGGILQLINQPNIPEFLKTNFLIPLQDFLKSIEIEKIVHSIDPNLLKNIGGNILSISSYVFLLGLHLFLALIVLFYGFCCGEKVSQNILSLIPMKTEYKNLYLLNIDDTVRAVIVGGVLTAFVQMFFGIIGFHFCKVSILWAIVMGFATALPVVGAAIIWGPICIFLCINGNYVAGIGLAIYCAIFVSSLDNFIRPYFIGLVIPKERREHKKSEEDIMNKISIYVTFLFAILGGLAVFGPSGLIFGPVIFALWKLSVEIYKKEFKDILEQKISEDDDVSPPNSQETPSLPEHPN